MMNNLSQIAQLVRGKDPKTIVMNALQNQKINNPNISQLINFMQSGDSNSFMNLAGTLFKQKGLDLNQELAQFKQLIE